ncbi:flagellin [Sporobacter termitidis DSM 10068]|uniref:Flagellin n=1 Tax=Sporobacter termitidis DSM 10068 TaxID=1123282 RepID=A0A1M5W8G0_9FIRM|nr:flagellin [Sporobacter termitidis]SHH83869.1 flagellin [Sporobacter termitidis DSM 10068]
MRINTNLTAMNTFTQYTKNQNKISSAVAKLSSGYAINSAADNAAGLAISEKMRAQIRGLDKANSNAQDAISLVQTAEGALDSSTQILQRMRELAVQSSNDTNNDDIDRTALQDEFTQLQVELNNISSGTTFNKKNLLDGSLGASTTNIGNVSLANSSMAISAGNVSAGNYGFNISVKQETAAISAKTGTTTVSFGTKASSTFTAATTTAPAKAGAIYNGNYTLSTTDNKDGTLTVNAKGDNGQIFTATVSKEALTAVSSNFAAGSSDTIALNFESSDGAADGFTASLTLGSAASTSTNGLIALSDAINNTTISVDGGVDAQAATYGVYASVTGGQSVKLHAGDSSVTFSNGITVGFDKLAATDAAVGLNTTSIAAVTDSGVTVATGTATFDVDLNDVVADYNAGDLKTYTVNIGSNTFSYTTTGKEADANAVRDALGTAIGTNGSLTFNSTDTTPVSATFASNYDDGTGVLTYTATTTGTGFDDVTTSATVTAASLSTGLLNKTGSADNITDVTSGPVVKTDTTSFTVSKAANAGLTFQVGANEGDEMSINIEKMDAQSLGVNSAKIDTQDAAKAAISTVDSAINAVSSQRATLGAIQNRLDYKIDNLNTSSTNLTSAESQIRDVDMAKEMTEFTNANILSQAATAMLAQANSLPQSVLSLIGK